MKIQRVELQLKVSHGLWLSMELHQYEDARQSDKNHFKEFIVSTFLAAVPQLTQLVFGVVFRLP